MASLCCHVVATLSGGCPVPYCFEQTVDLLQLGRDLVAENIVVACFSYILSASSCHSSSNSRKSSCRNSSHKTSMCYHGLGPL